MDDQDSPEIDTSGKPQTNGGGGTAKVAGGIGAVVLALLAGLARHADDLGRGVFRHADDFGRGASHFADDMGRGAARFGDNVGQSARFGDDLGQTARFGDDAIIGHSRFGQEIEEGFTRFGDDVGGSKAGFSDSFQPGSLQQNIDERVPWSAEPYTDLPPATMPDSRLPPTVPSESSHGVGARILLRAGQEAVRQSSGDRHRNEK